MADVAITSVVNTPSANIATKSYVDSAISGIDFSPYWNSDGSSTATGDFILGDWHLHAGEVHTYAGNGFRFDDVFGYSFGILYYDGSVFSLMNDGTPAPFQIGQLLAEAIYGSAGQQFVFSSFEQKTFLSGTDLYILGGTSFGPVLEDSSGVYWRIGVDTYGNLTTTSL